MGLPENNPWILEAKRKGLIPPLPCEDVASPLKPKLVANAFISPATWVIGAEVPSLSNDRDWRTRNRVTQAHRKAVSRVMGKHLRAMVPFAERLHAEGKAVRITLTRLGGRPLDKHDNLPASCKYILDAVCLFLGIDDADERLDVKHAQEPGGSCGVRIELSLG